MATKNAINNQTPELTVDPGASGDSFVQFDINATGEFRIGVDDTDDSFRVAQGSALGTSDTMVVTANGEVTLPLNSAFLGYIGSNDNNQTGDGTAYTIGTSVAFTEVFDQNADFNTNGTFTAPVTGRYYLSGLVRLGTPSGGGEEAYITIVTSNRTYFGVTLPLQDRVTGFYGASTSVGFSLNILADMDASDTAVMKITASTGAKTCDVLGSSTAETVFCGYLGT